VAEIPFPNPPLGRPDPEDPALGEIGYLLSAKARGRGYATFAGEQVRATSAQRLTT
jgi:RimJ/RimL family protein N-acetyltransferase